MRFFKRKLQPEPNFTTIEVEFRGVTYGYFLNWFKKEGGTVTEVKLSDLPEHLINFKIDNTIDGAKRDLDKAIADFRKSLLDRIDAIDKVATETAEFEIQK